VFIRVIRGFPLFAIRVTQIGKLIGPDGKVARMDIPMQNEQYEVEMKFPVADVSALESRLHELGGVISEPKTEIDVYFAHPARDFAQTDEALRIRRKGDSNSITYKGPKIDALTKTRHEIDLPLPPGEDAAAVWTGLLGSLGFSPVGEVRKSRRKANIAWQGRNVEVSLDSIDRLGTFVELELIAASEDVAAARDCILALAASLKLANSERRSYLELVLNGRK
jgi:adenylate cyclase, class 2